MKLTLLGAADLERALPMRDTVEAMKRAFAAYSTGEAEVPQRLAVPSRGGAASRGTMLVKPAALADGLGAKLVSVFPENPRRGLPVVTGIVVLLDPTTGEPAALCDGTFLTAWRTGAASGAATDLLARDDARRGAILGCGAQARTQLLAIDTVRRLESIRVYAPAGAGLEAFVEEMNGRARATVTAAADARDAMRGADVICAATTSHEPVFDGRDLADGAHVNGVGSYTPEMRELDLETVTRSRVFVDAREACGREAGELIHAAREGASREDDWIELGEVVAGSKPGRDSASELTLFKSVGLAVQDVAAAALALERARRDGLGREIEL